MVTQDCLRIKLVRGKNTLFPQHKISRPRLHITFPQHTDVKIIAWPRHIIKFLVHVALKLILIMILLAPYNKLGIGKRKSKDIKQDTDYYKINN